MVVFRKFRSFSKRTAFNVAYILLFVFSLASFNATGLELTITKENKFVVNGGSVSVKYLITNPSGSNRDNVTLSGTIPEFLSLLDGAALPTVENCGSSCTEGEIQLWNLGTIGAGEHKVVYADYSISASAPDGTVISFANTVGHDGDATDDSATLSVTVDTTPSIDLEINTKTRTAAAGTNVDFEIAYGNVGNTGFVNTQIVATVPSGMVFVSASDGGTLSGNEITWPLGVTNAGDSGKRFFTATTAAGAANSTTYQTSSTFSNNGSELATGYESVVVYSDDDLFVSVAHEEELRENGDFSILQYVVANKGSTQRTGVVLDLKALSGYQFDDGGSLPTITGCSFRCGDDLEDKGSFNIGTIAAGEVRRFSIQGYANSPADGQILRMRHLLSDDSGAFYQSGVTTEIFYDASSIDLVLSSSKRVIETNDFLEYEVSFGNLDSSSLQDVELTLHLPSSVSFVSSEDGGVESNGVVTWTVGTVSSGENGKRRVLVQADDGLTEGTVLQASAEINTGGPALNWSKEQVSITSDNSLNIEAVVIGDASQPGSYVDYQFLISNTGLLDRTDVTLMLKADFHLQFEDGASFPNVTGCSFRCGDSSEDVGTISIGTLEAGETRVVSVQMNQSSVDDGEVLKTSVIVGDASNNFQQGFTTTVLYNDSNNLDLVISSDKQNVVVGDEVELEIAFGNVSSSGYQDLELLVQLPEGLNFLSASNAGNHLEGVVTFDIGTLNAADNRVRKIKAQVANDAGLANILVAKAELNTGGPSLARASNAVFVTDDNSLTLDVTLTGDKSEPNSYVDARFVVSNTGVLSRTNVTLYIKADNHLQFEDGGSLPSNVGCSFRCGDSSEDLGSIDLGTLGAGESRVVTTQMYRSSVINGEILKTLAFVGDATNHYQQGRRINVLSEDEPTLDLSVAAEQQVVEAGNPVNVQLGFGNTSTSSYQNLQLEVELPDGVTFIDAEDSATHDSGIVSWDLGTLSAGNAGFRSFRVNLDQTLADADILAFNASLKIDQETLARAGDSVVIDQDSGMTVNLDHQGEYDTSTYQMYQLVVTNNGNTDKTDVAVTVKADYHLWFNDGDSLPSLTSGCQFYCGSSTEGWGVFAIGTLLPGESRAIPIYSYRTNAAQDGEIVKTRTTLTYGSNTSIHGQVVLKRVEEDVSPTVAISTDEFLVQPGEVQTIDLYIANPMSTVSESTVVEVTFDENYQFVSADGRVVRLGQTLFWPMGDINSNTWRKQSFRIRPLGSLASGTPVSVSAKLKNNSVMTTIATAQLTSVIDSDTHPEISISRDAGETVSSNSTLATEIVAINLADTEVVDVAAYFRDDIRWRFDGNDTVPIASGCRFACGGDTEEWPNWDLGNMQSDVSSTINFDSYYQSNSLIDGELLVSYGLLKHTSQNRHDYPIFSVTPVGGEFSVDVNHDSDSDGIPDWWEIRWGGDRLNALDADLDSDNDGLTDLEEYQARSNPLNSDTDRDGLLDGVDPNPLVARFSNGLDVDGNGGLDIIILGELSTGREAVLIYDTKTGDLVKGITFPSWFSAEQASLISDMNANSVEDIVVLGTTSDNKKAWLIFDSVSGSLLTSFSYPSWFLPDSIKVVADFNGNFKDEVLAIGSTSDGKNIWMLHDSGLRVEIARLIYPGWFTPSQVDIVSDTDGNNVPEVVAMGNTTEGIPAWMLHDFKSKRLIRASKQPAWSSFAYLNTLEDISGNSIDDIAWLGTTSDGKYFTRVQDANTASLVNTRVMPGWFSPTQFMTTADSSGNGSSEFVALGTTSDGKNAWISRDSNSGVQNSASVFPAWYQPSVLRVIPDITEDSANDILVIGQTTDGKSVVMMQEEVSGQQIRVFTLPGWFTPTL